LWIDESEEFQVAMFDMIFTIRGLAEMFLTMKPKLDVPDQDEENSSYVQHTFFINDISDEKKAIPEGGFIHIAMDKLQRIQQYIPTHSRLIHSILTVFQAIFESQEHPEITEELREDDLFWNKLQQLVEMYLTEPSDTDEESWTMKNRLYLARCICSVAFISASDIYVDLTKVSTVT
jgi:hypothetical protein